MKIILLTLFFTSCNLVDSDYLEMGKRVEAKFQKDKCFEYLGQVYQVQEVLNKNYKYQEIGTGKELIYPISSIELKASSVNCP